ncbi:hypothetical protein GmHk_09G025006 [Glycine max]|nr:hypothetical protein GmHk_09G025006 [Glycine max]
MWDVTKFGIPNLNASFFLTYSDVNEIISGPIGSWLFYALGTMLLPGSAHYSHVQSGGYECDYYVMHWMWNIVSGGLKNDWSMWFADVTTLDIETITTIQKKWVAYFVKFKNIRCIKVARYNDMDDVKILEATGVSLDSKDEQGRTGIFQSCVELTLKKKLGFGGSAIDYSE